MFRNRRDGEMARTHAMRHGIKWGIGSVGLALTLMVGLAAPALAASDQVFHDRFTLDYTRTVTNVCPFPVSIRVVGDLDDLYRFDAAGNLVEILETVQHLTITSSANGHSLTPIGTGGSSLTFGADGSVLGRIFGINSILRLPHGAPIVLDVGFQLTPFDLGE